MKKTLYLRDLLPFISYGVTLQIMEFSLTRRTASLTVAVSVPWV